MLHVSCIRKLLLFVVLPSLAAGCGVAGEDAALREETQSSAPAVARDSRNTYTAQVVDVVDGDTLDVRIHGLPDTIRLLNIDTPERGKPGYEQASQAMSRLVAGETVRLEWEQPGEPKRGSFNRLLAYVYVDGVNVNVRMVRLGWSEYWTKYGRSRLEEQFQQAEAYARTHDLGMWR